MLALSVRKLTKCSRYFQFVRDGEVIWGNGRGEIFSSHQPLEVNVKTLAFLRRWLVLGQYSLTRIFRKFSTFTEDSARAASLNSRRYRVSSAPQPGH